MTNLNLKIYGWIVISLAILTWVSLILITENNLQFSFKWCYKIPTVISINAVLWGLFIKWFWKWKIFQKWLVPFPNLSGKWEGEIISSYINPETQIVIPPTPSTITIHQTLFTINIKAITNEMDSNSIASSFIIDENSKQISLCYTYVSTPKPTVRERSPIHPGTALLKVENKNNSLNGEYWTSRKTVGEMKFNRLKKDKK